MQLTAKEFRAIQLRASSQDLQHLLIVLAADGEITVALEESDDPRAVVEESALYAARLFLSPPEPVSEELEGEPDFDGATDVIGWDRADSGDLF